MLEAFIIVLREGFEAFLIVAIIFSYLKKTNQKWLQPAVYAAIAGSIAASLYMSYLLKQGVNESLWSGIFGLIAIVLVATLIIHMRRVAPKFTSKMHDRLNAVSSDRPRWLAFAGVFLFSVLMITREGMETALMLAQVRGDYLTGAILGLVGASVFALLWARFGHLVNMKRFFQVTTLFLVLFMFQIALYTFHEFAESGIFGARSEAWHEATEILSPDGIYGKWLSLGIVSVCALWLVATWIGDRFRRLPPMATPLAK
ncbi:MAG: FTR1 family protein [Acidobacteriota bacterium]